MGDSFSCPSKVTDGEATSQNGHLPQEGVGYWKRAGEYWWELWPLTLANTMNWYEFAIYSNMEPYISQNFFGNSDTIAWAVYSISFIMQPLGGLLFGSIADRFGRRPAVLGTLILMCTATVGQGVAPTVPYVGPVWLVTCRILQGLGDGGETGSVSVFMAEQAHPSILTWSGVLNYTGTQMGFALSSLTSLILLGGLGGDLMMSWGWRIPFLLVLAPGSYTIWKALSMPETSAFEEMQRAENHEPWHMSHQAELLKEHWIHGVFAGVGVAGGYAVAYLGCTYLQEWLVTYCGTSRLTAFWVILCSNLLTCPLAIPFAWYGDHFGVGNLTALSSGIGLVTAVPMYAALLAYPNSLVVLGIAGVFMPAFALSTAVGTYPFAATLFPTEIRGTGFSMYWGLSALTGGFAPAICTAMNTPLGAGYYTAFFSGMSLIACLWAIFMHKEYQRTKQGHCISHLNEDLF